MPIADLSGFERQARAPGLVLLRLGQLGLRHHGRHGALRAVPHVGGRDGSVRSRSAPTPTRARQDLQVLGLAVSPGSLVFYVVTLATVALGAGPAGRGRGRRPVVAQEDTSWPGSPGPAAPSPPGCSSSTGDNWQLGAVLLLVRQPVPGLQPGHLRRDPVRDRHSGRAGPGLVTRLGARLPRRRPAARSQPGARHPARLLRHSTRARAVRLCLLSAAVWWGAFTVIPYRGLRDRPAVKPCCRAGRPGPAELRPALGHAAGHAGLPDDADVPAGLPVLQRRHPDGHRVRLDVRREAARVLDRRCSSRRSCSCSSSRSAGRCCSAGSRPTLGRQEDDPRWAGRSGW